MQEPDAAVDVSTVRLAASFPEFAASPGEFAVLATLLSPEGVRVDVRLPGGEARDVRTSGRDLLCSYALLAAGRPAPWCLGDGMAETDGDRVLAPGTPPLVGSAADFRRTLGTLVAELFGAIEAAGADPVATVERCLGPGVDVDVAAVYDDVVGRR